MRKMFLLCVTALACGRAADNRADTAAAPAATIGASAAGNVGGLDDTTDREFLRMFVDHQEGLIQMATAAMTKASKASTQADAHTLHVREAAERDSLLSLLRTASTPTTTYTPTVTPGDRALNDSLQAMTGAAYDRAFYRMATEHQRHGIAMIDSMAPRLTNDQVKRMAATLKTDHEKEIAEFGKKGP